MRRGFTLVELLVAIAIIAVLAAILFPVLASSKMQGKKTVAISDIRQLLASDALYRGEWDGFLTPSRVHALSAWREPVTLRPYGITVDSLKDGQPHESDLTAEVPVFCTATRLIVRLRHFEDETLAAYDDFDRIYCGVGVVGFADSHVQVQVRLTCPPEFLQSDGIVGGGL
jgi:prepilin-type N-terminal cleavage/methylation domain-containing protein